MECRVKVEHLAVGDKKGTAKSPRDVLEFTLEGIVGDRHAGFVKPADGRDEGIKRGTPIRNWRQWSALSVEELKLIAEEMQLDRMDPCLLGANLTFSGIEQLTQLPKGSMLWFPSGLILVVEGENAPCIGPGKEIQRCHPEVKPASFPRAAKHRRGVVGVVYHPGTVKIGEEAVIRFYEPFDALPRAPQVLF